MNKFSVPMQYHCLVPARYEQLQRSPDLPGLVGKENSTVNHGTFSLILRNREFGGKEESPVNWGSHFHIKYVFYGIL